MELESAIAPDRTGRLKLEFMRAILVQEDVSVRPVGSRDSAYLLKTANRCDMN